MDNKPTEIRLRGLHNCDYCGKIFERNIFCSASCKVRYYRKTGLHIQVVGQIRWEVWKRDDFTCKICGGKDNLQVDHIVPQSKGGKSELNNLQTLCADCNKRKNNMENGKAIEKIKAIKVPKKEILREVSFSEEFKVPKAKLADDTKPLLMGQKKGQCPIAGKKGFCVWCKKIHK